MKLRFMRLRMLAAALALLLLATGCAGAAVPAADSGETFFVQETPLDATEIEDEAVALAATPTPAIPNTMMPVASGSAVQKTDKAEIDHSNISDGYVMVRYTASTSKKLKVQVKGPTSDTYTYSIKPGSAWTTFPLSDGNGSYKVTVFENVSGNSYSTVTSVTVSVTLKDAFGPFLLPNQYVNYKPESKVVKKAAELVGKKSDMLEKVQGVYNYVVNNITYDKSKAGTVQSGYLPVLDNVLDQKRGICFDYASVMAAMLRSQNVPTKLVVGFSGKVYHAWINVYSEETGWIDSVIYFDGSNWNLMDPTFASSGNQSKEIMSYIGNGANYTAKYIY